MHSLAGFFNGHWRIARWCNCAYWVNARNPRFLPAEMMVIKKAPA
jgi:hypothetical protein